MKLDIIFAGAAKDEQQEKLLLDLLSPLGIDKHTMTEAKSARKAMESALVTALLRSLCCAGISLRRPAPRFVFLVFHGVHPSVGLVSVL